MSCYMLLYIFNKNEESLIELQPSADHQTRSLLGAWPRTGGCPFEEVQITNQHLGKSKSETMWSESAILCKPVDTQLRFAKAAGRKQISGRRVGCNGLNLGKAKESILCPSMSHLCLNECLNFLKICVFWEDHGGSQIRLYSCVPVLLNRNWFLELNCGSMDASKHRRIEVALPCRHGSNIAGSSYDQRRYNRRWFFSFDLGLQNPSHH